MFFKGLRGGGKRQQNKRGVVDQSRKNTFLPADMQIIYIYNI
jgi:hypothetical protein